MKRSRQQDERVATPHLGGARFVASSLGGLLFLVAGCTGQIVGTQTGSGGASNPGDGGVSSGGGPGNTHSGGNSGSTGTCTFIW